jgi:uncharacterized protein YggE
MPGFHWTSSSGMRGRQFRFRLLAASVLAIGLTTGSVAAAQDATDVPPRGVTVVGYGLAAAPAETAQLQMVASRLDFAPPRPPDPGATPGAEELEAIGPMVDALTAAGVAEDDIRVVVSPVVGNFYGPGGPGVARVDVNIDEPSPERITELINAGIVGAAEEDLVVQLVGVGYGVADCAPLQREARAAALADAQLRADLQAELIGVELGQITAVADVPVEPGVALSAYYGPTTPTDIGCAPPAPAPTSGSPITVAPFDPTGAAEVTVYAQVAVTYEMGRMTGTPAA